MDRHGVPPEAPQYMFLDRQGSAVRKVRIRKTYAPGSIDYGISEVKQAGPLEVTAQAELLRADTHHR